MIGNAAKFTYKGSIAVTMEFEKITKKLEVHVKDSGIGISAEDLSKLFKFFG